MQSLHLLWHDSACATEKVVPTKLCVEHCIKENSIDTSKLLITFTCIHRKKKVFIKISTNWYPGNMRTKANFESPLFYFQTYNGPK